MVRLASFSVGFDHMYAVASVGFIQQTWKVSEDTREATLLVESDGRNVDLIVLEYSFQNASETAEGSLC